MRRTREEWRRGVVARVAAWGVAWVVAACAGGGCTVSLPRGEERGARVGGGSAAMAAFGGPGVVGEGEGSRRDGALVVRSMPTVWEREAWPTAARPSLSRSRRLFVSESATSFTYTVTREQGRVESRRRSWWSEP